MREAQSNLTTHPGEGEPQRSDTAAGSYQQQIKSYEYDRNNPLGDTRNRNRDMLMSRFHNRLNRQRGDSVKRLRSYMVDCIMD